MHPTCISIGLGLVLVCALVVGCGDEAPVGFIGTLSGTSSEPGRAGRDGAQLFFEMRGAEFSVCDDHGRPDSGVACLRSLAASGVRVVVGPNISSVAMAIAAEADRLGVLLVSPTVSTARLSGKNDLFIKLSPDNLRAAELLARRFLSSGVDTVSIFYDLSNPAFSEPIVLRFDSIVRSAGKIVLGIHPYTSNVDLDFRRQLAVLPDSSAALLVSTGMDMAVFEKDRARAGMHVELYGTHWALGEDLLRVGGVDAEGAILLCMREQFDRNPRMDLMRTEFKKRFGHIPSFGAVFSWEAAWLALRVSSLHDPVAARNLLLGDSAAYPLGWALGLDSMGDSRRSFELCRVHDGRYEVVR